MKAKWPKAHLQLLLCSGRSVDTRQQNKRERNKSWALSL